MKISRCIRSGRVQSGKYGFLVFLRRNFSICCTINFFFPNVFQFPFIWILYLCFSSRVNRKVMTEFDLYLEFNKNSI